MSVLKPATATTTPTHLSLNCHPALLDLHSFPTRRSSDLGRGVIASGTGASGRARRAAAGAVAPWEAQRRREDRKSTRLNSSHRTISYAVFCLKKKKLLGKQLLARTHGCGRRTPALNVTCA